MLKIRHAQPQDIFSVIKITYDTLPERYSPVVFNRFYEIFPKGFLVAEKLQKIVGFIVGIKTSNITSRITLLSVITDYRRQGIGSALITQFLKEMVIQKITKVELEVRVNNIAAVNFYKKHGFFITDTIRSFYQDGEDACIMKKKLLTC